MFQRVKRNAVRVLAQFNDANLHLVRVWNAHSIKEINDIVVDYFNQ